MSTDDNKRQFMFSEDSGQKTKSTCEWAMGQIDNEKLLEENVRKKIFPLDLKREHHIIIAMDAYKRHISGLLAKKWSGVITVDTGYGIKKIYLGHGNITFASSNIVDDRLGEVIYRNGLISLDELAGSSGQVDRTLKFGQVLLARKLFNNVNLWQALKYQVLEIIRSTFLARFVSIEIDGTPGTAPTEVTFTEKSEEIFERFYNYGNLFKNFVSKITEKSQIEINKGRIAEDYYTQGMFVGDFLSLVNENKEIRPLVEASKLPKLYSLAVLMSLVDNGICGISPNPEMSGLQASIQLVPLKEKLDIYDVVLQRVQRGFSEEGKEFPLEDLKSFAISLNFQAFSTFTLGDDGKITRECIRNIFGLCLLSKQNIQEFLIRLESLNQFLLQMSGDLLNRDQAKEIRDFYRKLIY